MGYRQDKKKNILVVFPVFWIPIRMDPLRIQLFACIRIRIPNADAKKSLDEGKNAAKRQLMRHNTYKKNQCSW
jgi:hypothetical protein